MNFARVLGRFFQNSPRPVESLNPPGETRNVIEIRRADRVSTMTDRSGAFKMGISPNSLWELPKMPLLGTKTEWIRLRGRSISDRIYFVAIRFCRGYHRAG
jgi:hypothetical protein